MSELLQARDYRNNPITVGCTLVYPIRQGSSMWLQHMVVSHVEIIRATSPKFKIHGTNNFGKTVRLEHPDRCVIV